MTGWGRTAVGTLGAFAVAGHVRRARQRARRAAAEVRAAAVDRAVTAARLSGLSGEPSVVVVMAALNEAESVGDVLDSLPRRVAGLPLRAVVVDDGSTDKTARIAADRGAVVASHSRNLGQGDGLRTGFAVALALGASVVVTMDADGQHDAADLAALVGPVVEGSADYVQGSRFLGRYDDAGSARDVGIRGFTALINALSGTSVTDCTNGYRAVRASGLARTRLVEGRFSAAEIIIEAAACRLRILEVPVHIRRRAVGESRKPRGLGYPVGFLGAILRSWARTKGRSWDRVFHRHAQ